MARIAVIGSGLSGLSVARALIRRGLKPTIIDAGVQLEPPAYQAVQRMSKVEPSCWLSDDVALIRRNRTLDGPGIPRKLVFGSDYIYARDHPEAGLSGENVMASTTLAKGGFGNAWGAALLSATDDDLGTDWPVGNAELDAHYRNVMLWMPLAAGDDALQNLFPTFSERYGSIDLPEQATRLREDLEQVGDPRLSCGQARLAVYTDGSQACRYCGLCLSGCVYDSIFSPTRDIDSLVRDGLLEYRPGWLVRQVKEVDGKVAISAQPIAGGPEEEHLFDRVFLAAGALGSTRILLASLKAYDTPVDLVDSQKFLVPLIRYRAAPFSLYRMNSLAALFVEYQMAELGDNIMHVQLSTVSEFIVRRLKADRSRPLRFLLSPLLNRIVIAWCSLHSHHSGGLRATLRVTGGRPQFEVENIMLDRARTSVRVALRVLARLAPKFRSKALPLLAQLSLPGAGNHTGGSFPMRSTPAARFETDLLGRPRGFERLHIVDSTVMPSIPATTIALLMMANADRIGTQAEIS